MQTIKLNQSKYIKLDQTKTSKLSGVDTET